MAKRETYIRIPVQDKKDGDDVRNISISTKEGIRALYARNRREILTYLFARSVGWDMKKAKAWMDLNHGENKKKIFRGGKVVKGYGRDVDFYLSPLDDDDPFIEELENLILDATQKGWDEGLRDVGASDNTVIPPEAYEEASTIAFQTSQLVKDSIKGNIAKVIIEGYNLGMKQEDIAAKVRELVDAPIQIDVPASYNEDGSIKRRGYSRQMPIKQWAAVTARTETQNAGVNSMIQSYKNMGFKQAKWLANPDACELCRPFDGKTFELDELKSLLPYHPNCRCVPSPVKIKTIGNKLFEQLWIDGKDKYLEDY